MNLLHSSKSIPAWQMERANKLQRACLRVQAALARGEKITTALRKTSRYYHRRVLKSDSARRIQLSPPTLRRHFEAWKNNEQTTAAFVLKYRARRPYVSRPLLVRFVEFCAANRLASVREAWQNFSIRKQNARAREITYGQICYHFPSADFYLM